MPLFARLQTIFAAHRPAFLGVFISIVFAATAVTAWQMWPNATPDLADPGRHQKVSPSATLKMLLPVELKTASLKESLALPEGVTGELKTEGRLLTFTPTAPLKIGQTLAFTLDRAAVRADGRALGKDLEYTFEVAGLAKLAATTPARDTAEVPADAAITLTWDRPVVPLATKLSGKAAIPAIEIEPKVAGEWRWLGTSTLRFQPQEGFLSLGTAFTLTVPAHIPVVNGETTGAAETLHFSTETPRVLEMQLAKDAPFWQEKLTVGPNTPVVVRFSQPVDLASLREHLQLSAIPSPTDGENLGKNATLSVAPAEREARNKIFIPTIAPYYEDAEDGQKALIAAAALLTFPADLPHATDLLLVFDKGIRSMEGTLGSADAHFETLRTVDPLKVTSSADGQKIVPARDCFSLQFSSPVVGAGLKKMVKLTPATDFDATEVENNQPEEWVSDLQLSCALAPATDYTVTVAAGLTDFYGQKLEKDYELKFRTADLPPSVSIGSEKGKFVVAERSHPPVINLKTVNVATTKLALYRVSLAEYFAKRGEAEELALPNAPVKEWQIAAKNPARNAWNIREFDVQKELGNSLENGIYVLTASAPEYTFGNAFNETAAERKNKAIIERQFFTVTNLGITLKYSRGNVLTWVTDLQTGAPVADATVTLHTRDGKTPATGTTDASGFFTADVALPELQSGEDNKWNRPEFWVTAEKAGDLAFLGSNWNRGIQPWDFGIADGFNGNDLPYRLESQIYTERALYRPGDTVHLKGLVRLRDDNGRLKVPTKNFTAKVTFQDAEYNEILVKTVNFSPYGGFAVDLPLSVGAPLGDYNVSVRVLPEEGIAGNYANTYFAVQAYRKPEYKVEVTADKTDYFDSEKVAAKFAGSYFFGGPLANAKVKWRATATDYFFNKGPVGEDYSFALNDAWCAMDCARGTRVLTESSGKLDANGNFAASVPVDLQAQPVSQVITVEADVTDANNQITSGRTEVIAHKSQIYTGIKTQEYVVAPRSAAKVDVITLKPDGSPAPGTRVTVQLFTRTWQTVKKKSVDGEYYYDNTPKDTFVKDATVTTGKEGKGQVSLQVEGGGEYRFVATAKDADGRESKAGTSIYAWDDAYVSWAHTNTDRLDIVADKAEYRVGETATLLVKSPWAGAGVRALVTVEREGILDKKIVEIKSTAQKITLPVTDDFTPNAYVSVVILKPRQGETYDTDNRDTGVPAFRVGYVKLNVNVDAKKLAVTLATDKAKYAPGETVHAKLTAKDNAGKPVVGEFSLGVVDMSLIALTGFQLPDLVANFYHERGLEVATSEMLQYLLERYKPGTKGGGGTDPEMKKRGNFKDTAYWNPNIVTNKNGEAEVSFALPDNLTTWQLLALGSTADSRFGAVAKEILETKRVLLRPVRPRFAVVGDSATLGAIVHNYLDNSAAFQVSLAGSGFTLAPEKAKQTVTIPAGGSVKVDFPVVFAAGENASFTFLAETAGARDEVEEKIPVYRFGTVATAGTTLVVDGAKTDGEIYVPSKTEAENGTLTVHVTSTLATFFPNALAYLESFGYACTEQLVSQILPRVLVSKLPGEIGQSAGTPGGIEKLVTQNLTTIYTRQKSDGGFAYWPESQRSDVSLTAYTFEALTRIAAAGYAVDGGVRERARDYLANALRDEKLALPTRAEILFALAEAGQTDAARTANLFDKRSDLPLFARAELAMVLQKLNTADSQKQAQKVLAELLGFAKVTARELHFEERRGGDYREPLSTDDRTNALALLALTRLDSKNILLPKLTRYLTFHRDGGHWDSTQSTAWMLTAFTEYLAKTNENAADFAATIRVAGQPVLNPKFAAGSTASESKTLDFAAFAAGELNPFEIAKTGAGKLYVDFLLSYFATGDTLPAVDEGFSVTREIFPVADAPVAPTVGATYRVKLTVTVPETRRAVAVESPLPAGFEIINTTLANTAQSLGAETAAGKCAQNYTPACWKDESWRFSHTELRDDRVFLFADELPAGAYEYEYLVRATTPGHFRQRPAHVWEMYFPETFGQTTGEWLDVLDVESK